MWHILEKHQRRVARKVDAKYAEYLEKNVGGETVKFHTPRYYLNHISSGEEIPGKVMGYISNENAIYAYGQYVITADGNEICTVTRKQDAFRIMQALKRDYKDIIVCLKT